MKTRIIDQSDPLAINETLKVIESGGVVALPTDTVYGIACSPKNPKAIQSLYQIKIRANLKAIPVLLADMVQMNLIAENPDASSIKLAKSFWPGALTLIVKKNASLPPELTIYPTVGIRIPDHNWLREIMRYIGPLAATSANISGEASPRDAKEVLSQLGGRIELIIDGGECSGGISSTVVDCSNGDLKILREGAIPSAEIIAVLSKKT